MSRLRGIAISAGIAAIPVLSLGCFTTLAIYAGNPTEFSMSFPRLLQYCAPWFLAVIAGAGALGALVPATKLPRYHALLAAIGILVWLQGNILVWNYGVLDGREIDWLDGAWRGALDIVIWIVVLAAAGFAYRRLGRLLVTAAVVTLVIQVINAAVIVSGPTELNASRVNTQLAREGRAAMARFSTQQNVLHIVMDGFQADIFEAIVTDPANGIVADDLRGFTLFRNNIGLYPYTQLTIPAMLSGAEYRNHVEVDDFVAGVMTGETILSAAFDQGYEIDLAAQVSLLNSYTQAPHTHAYATVANAHVTDADYIRHDAARLVDLALFRAVPHFAKALVHRDELWIFQAMAQPEAYLQMKYFSDLRFLEQLAATMTVDREAPVYKLLHVMLSHKPTVGSADCKYDGRQPTTRRTVTNQARCGLWRVVDVLQRMQDLGIYDNSLIILMGDHGAWVPLQDTAVFDGSDADPLIAAMALPVLAVKPPAADNDLAVSEAPTTITDLPATIARLAGLDAEFPGTQVFEVDPAAPRKRRHLVYGYGINPASEGYLFPMQVYEVSGSPYDGAAWAKSNRYLPGGEVDATE